MKPFRIATALIATVTFMVTQASAQDAKELVREKISEYYGSLSDTSVNAAPELHSATVVLEQNLGGTITSTQLRSVIRDIYSGLLRLKDGSIKKVEVFVWKQDGDNPEVWHPVWHVIANGKKAEWDSSRESFLEVVPIILKEINGPWEKFTKRLRYRTGC